MADTITTRQGIEGRLDADWTDLNFPTLGAWMAGKPLVHVDNAVSTQEPPPVMDRLCRFYTSGPAKNEEEHALSQAATGNVGWAGRRPRKCCTHPARSRSPSGASSRVAPITLEGDVNLDALERLLPDRKRVVSVSLVSYALGTAFPVARTAEMARTRGAGVVIDSAGAKPHLPVNVKEIGCDLYAGCGHKIYGPTSVSILYGKLEWLDRIPPMEGGSDNSRTVSFGDWDAKPPPQKFVAGTPPLGGIIAFGTAAEYLQGIGPKRIKKYEDELHRYLGERPSAIPGPRVLGSPQEKVCLTSFVREELEDQKKLSRLLEAEYTIALHAGSPSTQPLMKHPGLLGADCASLPFYNIRDVVGQLVSATERFQHEHVH
jgi:cysteine desulfurase/selenocysteine lyase